MNSRRIFIGDVHGHYDGLMDLMDAIAPTARDQIYFLGDLIDRGPKSADVVEFVRSNGYVSIMGNHEQLFLESFPNRKMHPINLQAWCQSGGQETIYSYQNQLNLLFDHMDWIADLPTHLDLGDVWLAHAGLHPGLPLSEQTAYEFCWIRNEFHSMTKPYFSDKLIITGHTITFTLPGVAPGEIAKGAGWLGIDTGAYHPKSGWLTAIDLDNNWVYQAHTQEQYVRTLPLAEACAPVTLGKMDNRSKVLNLR